MIYIEAEVEPELVDEEKKPRLDCYFILLAVVFGSSVLVVILYFTSKSDSIYSFKHCSIYYSLVYLLILL